jgi:hypothetical protein
VPRGVVESVPADAGVVAGEEVVAEAGAVHAQAHVLRCESEEFEEMDVVSLAAETVQFKLIKTYDCESRM